jgi:predicted metal-dependent phosphoesterase TrpH
MIVDYHFHPNLSKYDWLAKRRCLKIWREFARQQVDVIVVTEHVFKNPPRAYRLLLETRPTDSRTVLFPGVEALTSEGIDMIVFAESDVIYEHQKLMVPKQLSELDMVAYIRQHPELTGSIAHPAMFAHAGSERRVGKTQTITAIRQLGGAEIANSCFKGFVVVMRKFRLENILRKKRKQIARVIQLPDEYYKYPEVVLYTGGSDAHSLDEIGSGIQMPNVPLTDRPAVYRAIRTNQSTEFVTRAFGIHPYFAFIKLASVIQESLIKAFRLYEGKLYQNDDAFTNYYGEAEKEAVLAWRQRWPLVLKPVLNFLTYFSVSPTLLNILSFLLIIASVVQVTEGEPIDAVIYFGLYVLASGLTGPLERYQHKESEAGAITHIVLYQFALIAGMLAAMALNWVDNWLGAVYLLLYTTMLWLMITLNKLGRPLHLVIRSKNIMLGAILLKITLGINWLTPLVAAFSIYMAFIDVVMLVRLLQLVEVNERTSKRNTLPPQR